MKIEFRDADLAKLTQVPLKNIAGVHEDVWSIEKLARYQLHYRVPKLLTPISYVSRHTTLVTGAVVLERTGECLWVIGGMLSYRWAMLSRATTKSNIYVIAMVVPPQTAEVRRAIAVQDTLVQVANAGSMDDGKRGLIQRVLDVERASYVFSSGPADTALLSGTTLRTAQRVHAEKEEPLDGSPPTPERNDANSECTA